GADPRAFGGRDLVERLGATGPAPERQEKKKKKKEERAADDDGSWPGVGWLVGVGLLVGAGAGFLLSGRRKAGRS
ncbi:hypothetical protein GTY92_28140, partial [Streptomyces sp. SID4950]|nr:hypothetical protein [Streptomyces sp. SID4950]